MDVDIELSMESPEIDVEVANQAGKIIPVLHDDTLVGDGITEPMGVNTEVVATKDDIPDVSGFATKEEIALIPKFKIVVVATLPETGEDKTIYLVPKDGDAPDIHDEYIWVDGAFELIGTTAVVLSDYLPLAGGTMAGNIEFAQPETGLYTYYIQFYQPSTNLMYRLGSDASGSYRGFGIGVLKKSSNGAYSYSSRYAFTANEFTSYDRDVSLGCSDFKWVNVYATKLNNGADLAIPTTGGTIARIEDIDAAVGNISTALTAILGE